MAKLTIPKVLDATKLLQTEAGQQLQDLIQFVSTSSQQLIAAVKGTLTFSDNIDSLTPTLTLTHAVAQVVNTNGRMPVGIIPMRVISTSVQISSFGWYQDSNGKVNVNCSFVGAPTAVQQVVVLVLFG